MDNTKPATNGHDIRAVSSPGSRQYITPIISSHAHAQISAISTAQPDDDLSLGLELTGYFDVERRRRLLEQARKLKELDELRTRALLDFNATAGSIFSPPGSLSRAASLSISSAGMGTLSPLTLVSPKRCRTYGDERQEPAKAARVSQEARRTPSATQPENNYTHPPWSPAIIRNFKEGPSSNAPEASASQRTPSARDKGDLSHVSPHVSRDISAPRSCYAERAEPSSNSSRDRRKISMVNRTRNGSHGFDDSRPDKPQSGEVIKPGTRFFLVKPLNMANVHDSQGNGIWITRKQNAPILAEAFKESKHVILLFSVTGSKAFQGYAKMTSAPGPGVERPSWMSDILWDTSDPFRINWKNTATTEFWRMNHLKNALNDHKPVFVGRDGQEFPFHCGREMAYIMDEALD